jgi:hypothetical protein
MKRQAWIALAALAGLGAASPALAEWDNIGSIDVSYGADHDKASPDFGGPVERLQLTARGGDVQCSAIRATYGNGGGGQLFAGMLREGQPRQIDLPGKAQTVRRLDFVCRSFSHGGAKIQMDADVGQYRAQWRASPAWNQTWSRVFHWTDAGGNPNANPNPNSGWNAGNANNNANNWVLIGNAKFDGPNDRDGGSTGWAGRGITALGFKATNGDAICGPVTVRYTNDVKRSYPLNNGQPLSRDRVYQIDMPGDRKNVAGVALRCRALGNYSVTVNIYGNK